MPGKSKNIILSGFSTNPNKFFNSNSFFKEPTHTIVVIYTNGYSKDFHEIQNPWKFMNGMKKNPKVQDCYILE